MHGGPSQETRGKMEYVGIDVAKDQLQVCVLTPGRPQRRFENRENGWRALTKWLKTWGEVWVALEATGTYGEGVSDLSGVGF